MNKRNRHWVIVDYKSKFILTDRVRDSVNKNPMRIPLSHCFDLDENKNYAICNGFVSQIFQVFKIIINHKSFIDFAGSSQMHGSCEHATVTDHITSLKGKVPMIAVKHESGDQKPAAKKKEPEEKNQKENGYVSKGRRRSYRSG